MGIVPFFFGVLTQFSEQVSSPKFLGGVKAWPNYRSRFTPIPAIPPYAMRTPHIHGMLTTDDTIVA